MNGITQILSWGTLLYRPEGTLLYRVAHQQRQSHPLTHHHHQSPSGQILKRLEMLYFKGLLGSASVPFRYKKTDPDLLNQGLSYYLYEDKFNCPFEANGVCPATRCTTPSLVPILYIGSISYYRV